MKRAGWGEVVAGVAAVLALIVGVVLLAIQTLMPAQYDTEVFEAAVMALYPNAVGDVPISGARWDEASRQFFALRDYDTGKDVLSDLGSALVATGLFVLLVTFMAASTPRAVHFVARTHGIGVVVLMCALASMISISSGYAAILIEFERYAYPPWADSIGIPMMGLIPTGVVIFVFLLAFAGAPHLKRRQAGVWLAAFPARLTFGSVVAFVVYGSLALALCGLAVWSLFGPGGWLMTPALLIAIWLMLHARAVTAG